MADFPPCPVCKCEYTYQNGELLACPECFHEWNPADSKEEEVFSASSSKVIDSNGNELQDGDSV
ncbi:MAG: alkylphosphonate utilization protein, partial [Thermoflexibacteraceae bacterium]